MAPLGVGFIGLSATSSWGTNAHLPYLSRSSAYKIVALCNSSEDSARRAIEAHKLPEGTKAFGDPAALAADPDVDVVVCSVRVDRHHPVLKPVLENLAAGKRVYCEWPLGKNLAEAEELTALAKARGIKTLVGLQGRVAPIPRKVNELLEQGRIGKVLSTSVLAAAYNFGAVDMESIAYLSDKETGGNMVSIHFSHGFDAINQTVGQLDTFSSILAITRPETLLRSTPLTAGPDAPIVGSVPRTTHDQVLIQGHLVSGALLSYHLRGGQPFPGFPGLLWTVYGESGEIRVTTNGSNLHIGAEGDAVAVHNHKTGKVEAVEVAKDQWDDLPFPARNVARLYEAFAAERTADYADWDASVTRHKLVEELYKRQEEGKQETRAVYWRE
ncbi:hypothetical protein DFJ74DRAFT_668054 [Hyaloraphidium curvatum]|nr:hypothetical protein DFJ74DRAFT_668054 [Hyaloraphidium curvatum]